MALANSVALKLAGITRDSKDPAGGTIVRGADGEPTGLLKDAAMSAVYAVIPPRSLDERVAAARVGLREAARFGVTFCDMSDSEAFEDFRALQPPGVRGCAHRTRVPVRPARRIRAPEERRHRQTLRRRPPPHRRTLRVPPRLPHQALPHRARPAPRPRAHQALRRRPRRRVHAALPRHRRRALGREEDRPRARQGTYAFRSLLDAGAVSPSAPTGPSPRSTQSSASTPPSPAAPSTARTRTAGSPGMLADIVVLSEDLFTIPPSRSRR